MTPAALIPLICVVLGVAQFGDFAAARGEPLPAVAPAAEIAGMVTAPHLVFRHTGVDRGYGMLSMAPLDPPDARHVALGMPCERVGFAAGQGICLQADRGVFTTFKAILFDRAFNQRSTIRARWKPEPNARFRRRPCRCDHGVSIRTQLCSVRLFDQDHPDRHE